MCVHGNFTIKLKVFFKKIYKNPIKHLKFIFKYDIIGIKLFRNIGVRALCNETP